MSRTPRPINTDKVTIAVLLMIGRHAGKPCPTRRDIIDCTGLPKRKAIQFIADLHDSGMIEMEEVGQDESRRRRMRVQGGPWTLWTQRRPPLPRKQQLMADAAGLHDDC